jgi:hypothetical protein
VRSREGSCRRAHRRQCGRRRREGSLSSLTHAWSNLEVTVLIPAIRSPRVGRHRRCGVSGVRRSSGGSRLSILTSTALLDPFDNNLPRSNASLCGRTFACFLLNTMHARPWDSCRTLATCSMFCFYEIFKHAALRSPNGYTDHMAHLITTLCRD